MLRVSISNRGREKLHQTVITCLVQLFGEGVNGRVVLRFLEVGVDYPRNEPVQRSEVPATHSPEGAVEVLFLYVEAVPDILVGFNILICPPKTRASPVLESGRGQDTKGEGTMAAPKRLSPAQIINRLRKAEVALANGNTTKEVCRELGVSEQTYYRWRREYGGE